MTSLHFHKTLLFSKLSIKSSNYFWVSKFLLSHHIFFEFINYLHFYETSTFQQ